MIWILAGCAFLPRGEYRAGAFLHRDPTYSFRIPEGWRAARASDVESFGYARLALKLVSDERRPRLRQGLLTMMEKADTVLISSGGAAFVVLNTPNPDGIRIPATRVLSEKERAVLVGAVTKALELYERIKTGDIVLESVELREYGPTPMFVITARVSALLTARVLVLTGSSHLITAFHVGTPENDDEGLPGVEELATSFRFE